MIVVPIEKDTIKTKDGLTIRVVSYTNFKDSGPAVYCRNRGDDNQTLVYFFDIAEINGTIVEYSKATRMFTALGKLSRAQNLPQPDDKVTVSLKGGEKITVEVATLKLKSKLLGFSRGMFFKDGEGKAHRVKSIVDISPAIGGRSFVHKEFHSTYQDYLGA